MPRAFDRLEAARSWARCAVGWRASKGMPDELVLAWSVRDERVLLTEDFDYGDLIFSRGHPASGVVILQLSTFPGSWDEVASAVVERLADQESKFLGNLTVLGRTRIKPRKLPAR